MVDFFSETAKYQKTYMYLLVKSIDDLDIILEDGENKIADIIKTLFEKIREFIHKIIRGASDFFYKLHKNRTDKKNQKQIETIMRVFYNMPTNKTINFPDYESMGKHMNAYADEIEMNFKKISKINPLEWCDNSSKKLIEGMSSIGNKYKSELEKDLNRKSTITYGKAFTIIKDLAYNPSAFLHDDRFMYIWTDYENYFRNTISDLSSMNHKYFNTDNYNPDAKTAIDTLNNFKREILKQYNQVIRIAYSFDYSINELNRAMIESLTRANVSTIQYLADTDKDYRKMDKLYFKGKLDPAVSAMIDKACNDLSVKVQREWYKQTMQTLPNPSFF